MSADPFRIGLLGHGTVGDRKSTRLNSSHLGISYAVFCLKKIKINGPGRQRSWDLNGSMRRTGATRAGRATRAGSAEADRYISCVSERLCFFFLKWGGPPKLFPLPPPHPSPY